MAEDHRLWLPPTDFVPTSQPLGKQLPRYFHAPQWTVTAGDDITDLAAACGVDQLAWQQFVARNAMAEDPITGKWLSFQVVLIVPRQNGKNGLVRFRLLAGLFLWGEEKLVHSAHLFKTAHSEYNEIRKIIENTPEFLSQVKSMPDSKETAIILKDGRRIDFVARSKQNGRGLQGDCVILDEAAILSEQLVSDLLPVLSSRKSPQVWYTSSTGFDDSDVLLNLRKKALEHPEDNQHLAFFEYSADLEQVEWDSPEAVAASNPSLGYLQHWQWIREVELGVMGREQYERERLGVWADRNSGAVIGADLWNDTMVTEEALVGTEIVRRSLALEVSADRQLAVIAGAALLSDGRRVVDIVACDAGTAWIQDTLQDLVRQHRPWAGVVIDNASGAASLGLALAGNRIPVSFAKTRDLVNGTLLFYDGLKHTDEDGVSDPLILHGSHPLLDDAAVTARKRLVWSSKNAWTWERFDEVYIEPLRAVTLAVAGLDMERVKMRKRVVI